MNRITKALSLTVVLSVLPVIGVASTFPSEPPAPATPKNFMLPEVEHFTLENGMEVSLIPYGTTPKSTMMLHFDTGNENDGDKRGLSDITFELLNKGTSSLSASDIAKQAASMGGQVTTSAGMNTSRIAIDVLSEFNEQAVALLADLVGNSEFSEADLERAVANQWRQIEVSKSRAQGQAVEAFYEAMYPAHPYGRIFPTNEELTRISRDDVLAFSSRYLNGSHAHLYIAGQFDSQSLKQAITGAFASLPAGTKTDSIAPPAPAPASQLVMIPRDGAVQSTVRLGQRSIPAADDKYVALEVMNTLLGGMFSSRITQNIREDKGYTYSPRSAVFSHDGAAVWYQSADIQAESTGEAINEIVSEIAGLQQTPPPAEELQGVKNYMSGLFVLRNSSRSGVIAQLVNLNIHGLPKSRLTNYISLVNDVSAETVSEAARNYLDLNTMSLIVVGDPEQMQTELSVVENLPATQSEK
ncbi:M16 family metallopeptidase [Alteromonas antoniana]|uniref:M16 family metallopeptidase n=1 Tax=Alteromonas antoniana TaxID=2803813 RepID=UPI001C43C392|nr:pitrilysin family protein [Alteromonas antoniana]